VDEERVRASVELKDVGRGRGPRVLLLPGLGARGAGFRALAERLAWAAQPVLVEYPEGRHAAVGAAGLATQVLAAVEAGGGGVDAVVASSFGGMVAAQLALRGAVRGVAFLGSFTRPEHLGLRGPLLAAMGPIALLGRPGVVAATVASWGRVPAGQVPDVVPTTHLERLSTWHRALAIPREPPPASLAALPLSCLCIQGARDLLVPPASVHRLAKALPAGTPVHLLPGAGHVPYFTHPEACAELLGPWLHALPAAPAEQVLAA
jgi:pimeloyl-ACP methyl ester carboxylesterase